MVDLSITRGYRTWSISVISPCGTQQVSPRLGARPPRNSKCHVTVMTSSRTMKNSTGKLWEIQGSTNQLGDLQDPEMEVLYHILGHIFWDIPLHRPYIGLIYGRYLQFRILKWPVNKTTTWKFIIYNRKHFGKLEWKLTRQLWEIGMENSPLSPVS